MSSEIPAEIQALLYDPQTSGGLLVSLRREEAEKLLKTRSEAYIIGRVKERGMKPLEVLV